MTTQEFDSTGVAIPGTFLVTPAATMNGITTPRPISVIGVADTSKLPRYFRAQATSRNGKIAIQELELHPMSSGYWRLNFTKLEFDGKKIEPQYPPGVNHS